MKTKNKIIAVIFLLVVFFITYNLLSSKKEMVVSENKNTQNANISLNEYKNTTYNFSFVIPDGFSTKEFEEEYLHVLLLENNEKNSIQILISTYDEGQNITPERIKKDIPDMLIQNSKDIIVGNTGKGIMFESNSEVFGGKSVDAWFVSGEYLYQISTYSEMKNNLENIIKTWKF